MQQQQANSWKWSENELGGSSPSLSVTAFFSILIATLRRLKQEIPLTEAECSAIEDGLEAVERPCARLANIPTNVTASEEDDAGPFWRSGVISEDHELRGI